MKKKYFMSCVILSFLLLLVLSGTTFAVWSQGEFINKMSQVYAIAEENGNNPYTTFFNNFINSNMWAQYKDTIPFDQYENLMFKWGGAPENCKIILFNNDTTFYVNNSDQLINNSSYNRWYISFLYNRNYSEFTFNFQNSDTLNANINNGVVRPGITGSEEFVVIFTNNTITNQYNKTIYGYNMTASTPVYNGSTNVDVGEYYLLSTGFIGSYYYDNDNYQNLDYVILCNDTTEYVGLKNIYYTPTVNGEKLDIYIYVEPSMNQKRI